MKHGVKCWSGLTAMGDRRVSDSSSGICDTPEGHDNQG